MIIAGIDYSYTSPAICIHNTEDVFEFEKLKFFNFYHPKKKKGFLDGLYENIRIDISKIWENQEERFFNISKWAGDILKSNFVEEVVLEGYSMGSKGGLVFDIAENTSLLKQFMYKNNIRFYKHAPTSVKKNFTGKGNANKELMIQTFYEKTGIELHTILGVKFDDKPIDDLVDSYANLLTHPHFLKEKDVAGS